MFSMLKLGFLSLSLGASALLVGCQSGGASAMSGLSTNAVLCDKCKVTWVREETSSGRGEGEFYSYSMKPEMVCSGCKDAVTSFFTTGKFEHTCSVCGGNMTTCAAQH